MRSSGRESLITDGTRSLKQQLVVHMARVARLLLLLHMEDVVMKNRQETGRV